MIVYEYTANKDNAFQCALVTGKHMCSYLPIQGPHSHANLFQIIKDTYVCVCVSVSCVCIILRTRPQTQYCLHALYYIAYAHAHYRRSCVRVRNIVRVRNTQTTTYTDVHVHVYTQYIQTLRMEGCTEKDREEHTTHAHTHTQVCTHTRALAHTTLGVS